MNKSFQNGIQQKNPVLIAAAVRAFMPLVPTLIEKIFGVNKEKRKLDLINKFIQSIPEDVPVHVIQDTVKKLNEG